MGDFKKINSLPKKSTDEITKQPRRYLEQPELDEDRTQCPGCGGLKKIDIDGEIIRVGGCSICQGHGKVCPICRGAGYLVKRVPHSHPDFGRLILCEACRIKVGDKVIRDLDKEFKAINNWQMKNLGKLG